MAICKFCNQEIFWKSVNGKFNPFNDSSGTERHNCVKIPSTDSFNERISNLEETVTGLKNLNSKMMTKITELEKQVKLYD